MDDDSVEASGDEPARRPVVAPSVESEDADASASVEAPASVATAGKMGTEEGDGEADPADVGCVGAAAAQAATAAEQAAAMRSALMEGAHHTESVCIARIGRTPL
jgi:hypothetical protein